MTLIFRLFVLTFFLSAAAKANLIASNETYVATLNAHRGLISFFSAKEGHSLGAIEAPTGVTGLYLFKNTLFLFVPGHPKLPYIKLESEERPADSLEIRTLACPLEPTALSVHEAGLTLWNQNNKYYTTYDGENFSAPEFLSQAVGARSWLCQDSLISWTPPLFKKLTDSNQPIPTYSPQKLTATNVRTHVSMDCSGKLLFDVEEIVQSGEFYVCYAHQRQHISLLDRVDLRVVCVQNFDTPVVQVHLTNGLGEALYVFNHSFIAINHLNNKIIKQQAVDTIVLSYALPGAIAYAHPYIQGRWGITLEELHQDKVRFHTYLKKPLQVSMSDGTLWFKLENTTALGYIDFK